MDGNYLLCIFLGILQFILITAVLIFEYRKKSLSTFLWAIIFLIFAVAHLKTCLLKSADYSNDILNEASIYAICFTVLYLAVRYAVSKNSKEVLILETEEDSENVTFYKRHEKKIYLTLYLILIFSILIRTVLVIVYAGGVLNITWETVRLAAEAGGIMNFLRIFLILYFVGSTSLIIAVKERNRRDVIIISLLMIFETVFSRNRIEILPLLCTFLIFFIDKNRKLNLKTVVLGVVLALITIYLVYALRAIRSYVTLGAFFENFSVSGFNEVILTHLKTEDGEMGLKKHLYYFIANDNNFTNFNKGHTYLRMLLVLIPTKLSFGLKPSDFAISMGHAVNPEPVGYSVHPTFFGDTYANFGFYGFIIMALFWALFVTVLDKIILKYKSPYLKMSSILVVSFTYVIIGRGSVYNGYFWMVFSLLLLYVIYYVMYKEEDFRTLIKKRLFKQNNG